MVIKNYQVSSEGCHCWQNIFSSGENQNKNHGTRSQALRVNWIWDVETETLSKFELMDGVPVRGLQSLYTLLHFLFREIILYSILYA